MSRLALVSVAACLLASGCGGGGGNLWVAAPHFRGAPGWHVGREREHACVAQSRKRCVQVEGWASTVPYFDRENTPPHGALALLPPDGIVIQLQNSTDNLPARDPPTGPWPPRIRARDVVGPFEGALVQDSVFQYLVQTGTTGRYLFVWFGRLHPTAEQLARANAELRTVSP